MSAVAGMRKLVRELERAGLDVELTGSGHYRVTGADGAFTILSKSPRRVPTLQQVRRDLEKRGVSA